MKCQKCGQETFLPFMCPYCGDQFCAVHRLLESHMCPKMELARIPKQEDAVAAQAPSSHGYTVTFGQLRRAKRRVYFGLKELKHLAVAMLLVVGIGFSVGLYSNAFRQIDWTETAVFTAILTASFFMHEVAHKVTAQKRGLWAEFRLTLWGAILTLISMISPFFKIISPGAVIIAGPALRDEIAKISIAGPATNIVLSALLLGVALVPSPFSQLLLFGAFFNAAWIALFNLIPFGILDGYKIFSWDKRIWGLAFAASLTLAVTSYILIQVNFSETNM